LKKDPEIIERINSYNFAETTAVGNPKFYDIQDGATLSKLYDFNETMRRLGIFKVKPKQVYFSPPRIKESTKHCHIRKSSPKKS
jgi:hypothetical protein